jgi:hypothetical protein
MVKNVSILHVFQAGSGAHPVSYLMGTGSLSRELNGRGVKLIQPATSLEVKRLPHAPSWVVIS